MHFDYLKNKIKLKKGLVQVIKIIGFLLIGIVLFWLVYKDQDFKKIWSALENANWIWLFISMILGILSHISRALRWDILLKPMGYKPRKLNLFLSVMVMYVTNLAIPRSGELVRCGVINRYENIPFTKLLGTVFIERVVDFIMLFVLVVIVLLTQFSVLEGFVENNQGVKAKFDSLLDSTPLLIALALTGILILTLIFIFRSKLKQTKIYKKVEEIIQNFIEGVITIKNMKKRGLFIAHSVFIWGMYFIMIYICFWSFDFTKDLPILAGLTVFVLTAFGMVAPSPGGMGTWHFMAIEGLFLYGVMRSPDGNAFALVAHGSQNVMILVVGLLSLMALSLINKTKIKENTNIEQTP